MDGGDRIEITVLGGIGDIAAAEWDACAGDGRDAAGRPVHHPPLPRRARGLRARSAPAPAGCRATSSPASGGDTIAVMPLYAKGHSQGEYIFDHNWAHAWETRRRQLLSEAAGRGPLHPGHRPPLPDPPGLRGRGPRRAAPGRADAGAGRSGVSGLHVTFCTARGARLGRGRRPARPHHPAVPLGEPRLPRLRRLPRRPRLAQAQGDPQGARARARPSAATSSR